MKATPLRASQTLLCSSMDSPLTLPSTDAFVDRIKPGPKKQSSADASLLDNNSQRYHYDDFFSREHNHDGAEKTPIIASQRPSLIWVVISAPTAFSVI